MQVSYKLSGCAAWVIILVCVCVGHETKSLLNNSGLRAKRSKLERDINIDVIFQVVILIVLCFVGAVGMQF